MRRDEDMGVDPRFAQPPVVSGYRLERPSTIDVGAQDIVHRFGAVDRNADMEPMRLEKGDDLVVEDRQVRRDPIDRPDHRAASDCFLEDGDCPLKGVEPEEWLAAEEVIGHRLTPAVRNRATNGSFQDVGIHGAQALGLFRHEALGAPQVALLGQHDPESPDVRPKIDHGDRELRGLCRDESELDEFIDDARHIRLVREVLDDHIERSLRTERFEHSDVERRELGEVERVFGEMDDFASTPFIDPEGNGLILLHPDFLQREGLSNREAQWLPTQIGMVSDARGFDSIAPRRVASSSSKRFPR